MLFRSVDIHAALKTGVPGTALRQKLDKALETCHAVLGEERDAGK